MSLSPQGAEKRGMVRCPRHNKTFDLATGESPGNCEILQTSLGILKTRRIEGSNPIRKE